MESFIENLKTGKQPQRYDFKVGGLDIRKGMSLLKEEVLLLNQDELEALENSWKATTEYNLKAAAFNKPLMEQAKIEAEKLFDALGIETWKFSRGKRTNDAYKEFKSVLEKIDIALPTKFLSHNARGRFPSTYLTKFNSIYVDGEHIRVNLNGNESFNTVVSLLKSKVEKLRAEKKEKNQLLQKSMFLAPKYDIDPLDENVVEMVFKAASNEFVEKEFVDGETVDISCCDECDEWVVGERRCSCGNKRMTIEVNGDILNGFNAYTWTC